MCMLEASTVAKIPEPPFRLSLVPMFQILDELLYLPKAGASLYRRHEKRSPVLDKSRPIGQHTLIRKTAA
jgi:hypothetical protein